MQSEQFDNAYIDRLVKVPEGGDANNGVITRFDIYYVQQMEASPYEVHQKNAGEFPEACLGFEWVYLAPDQPQLKPGRWAKFRGAGPNLDPRECNRTIVRFDKDGFNIEEPAVRLVILQQPFVVRSVRGQVVIGDEPISDARVEIRNINSKKIYTAKTGKAGTFAFPNLGNGEYKFKVTKNGFCALSGRIIVGSNGRSDEPFKLHLPLGT